MAEETEVIPTYPTRADVEARWDDLPSVRIRFASDESGWAKVVDAERRWYALANQPLSDGLNLFDLVEMQPDCRTIKQVLRPAYVKKTVIRYPFPNEEEGRANWAKLRAAAKDVGASTKDYLPGVAGLAYDTDEQLAQIGVALGVDLTEGGGEE